MRPATRESPEFPAVPFIRRRREKAHWKGRFLIWLNSDEPLRTLTTRVPCPIV
jgi:hypothetical protein